MIRFNLRRPGLTDGLLVVLFVTATAAGAVAVAPFAPVAASAIAVAAAVMTARCLRLLHQVRRSFEVALVLAGVSPRNVRSLEGAVPPAVLAHLAATRSQISGDDSRRSSR